jgi:hypothetical protein
VGTDPKNRLFFILTLIVTILVFNRSLLATPPPPPSSRDYLLHCKKSEEQDELDNLSEQLSFFKETVHPEFFSIHFPH